MLLRQEMRGYPKLTQLLTQFHILELFLLCYQSFASRPKVLKIVFVCPPAEEARIASFIEPSNRTHLLARQGSRADRTRCAVMRAVRDNGTKLPSYGNG